MLVLYCFPNSFVHLYLVFSTMKMLTPINFSRTLHRGDVSAASLCLFNNKQALKTLLYLWEWMRMVLQIVSNFHYPRSFWNWILIIFCNWIGLSAPSLSYHYWHAWLYNLDVLQQDWTVDPASLMLIVKEATSSDRAETLIIVNCSDWKNVSSILSIEALSYEELDV